MRINVAVPEDKIDKPVLDASLEAVTRLNESMIEDGLPTFREAKNQVRWKPEPPGGEHFDHAGLVLGRGWGDCDDLAPWHAASLRVTGKDPGARAVVQRSGPKKWHAVVRRSNGRIEDPSKEAGMRPGIAPGVRAAAVSSLAGPGSVGSHIAMPRLAIRPVTNPVSSQIEAWQARADLPWHWSPTDSPGDIAMASLHASPVASQSIVGALEGAIDLAEESGFVDSDTVACGEAISWVCGGADYRDVEREFGPEVADYAFETVDGLFKKVGRGLKKIGKGIVKVVTSKAGRGIISMIPGVGPAAATALDVASPALNKLASGKVRKGVKLAKKVNPFSMIKARKRVKIRKVKPGTVMRKKKPRKAKRRRVVRKTRKFPTDEFRKAVVFFPRES